MEHKKKFKVFLVESSTIEKQVYLKGGFQITFNEKGQPLSVRTEEKRMLIVGTDCEVYYE